MKQSLKAGENTFIRCKIVKDNGVYGIRAQLEKEFSDIPVKIYSIFINNYVNKMINLYTVKNIK